MSILLIDLVALASTVAFWVLAQRRSTPTPGMTTAFTVNGICLALSLGYFFTPLVAYDHEHHVGVLAFHLYTFLPVATLFGGALGRYFVPNRSAVREHAL